MTWRYPRKTRKDSGQLKALYVVFETPESGIAEQYGANSELTFRGGHFYADSRTRDQTCLAVIFLFNPVNFTAGTNGGVSRKIEIEGDDCPETLKKLARFRDFLGCGYIRIYNACALPERVRGPLLRRALAKREKEDPIDYLLKYPDTNLDKETELHAPWWIAWAQKMPYTDKQTHSPQPEEEVKLEEKLLSRRWEEIKGQRLKDGWSYVLVECDTKGQNTKVVIVPEGSKPPPTTHGRGVHPWRLDEKIVEAAFQALQKVAGQNLPELRDANSQS